MIPNPAATTLLSFVAVSIFFFWAFQWLPGLHRHQNAFEQGSRPKAPENLADSIFNSTLGFQKLFVINLPERSDHRDALALTGALSEFQFEFMNAIHGDTIPDKALPPGNSQRFNNAGRGSWRAHINAIRAIVEQNLTSAVIFEDDVDWDIRIKQQLYDFAKTSRALVQPLERNKHRFADPTFPVPMDPDTQAAPMSFDALPSTIQPEISPYGDNWDVLWLGHCGTRRPLTGMLEPWHTLAQRIPKGYIVHEDDPTVPPPEHIHIFDEAGHPRFRQDFPPHTRVTHHSMDGICSLVYAVSQAGARKLLYELAVQQFDDLFDIMLRQFCEGQRWHQKHTCLTVQPTLFEHHRPPGRISHDSVREQGFTLNIRWSTRLNVPQLLKGDSDYQDSYPDKV